MKNIFSRMYNSRTGRVVKLVALFQVVAVIFSSSVVLPTVLVTEAQAQAVPEIPTIAIPLFLLIAASAMLYIRRRSLAA